MKRVSEEDEPVGWSEGRRERELGKAGMAPTASLARRPSEKAEVLEKALPDIQGLRTPRTSKHTFTYKNTHHAHDHAASAGVSTAVWRLLNREPINNTLFLFRTAAGGEHTTFNHGILCTCLDLNVVCQHWPSTILFISGRLGRSAPPAIEFMNHSLGFFCRLSCRNSS